MYGIFAYNGSVFMANGGKYTSPMDPMGLKIAHLGGWQYDCFGLAKKKDLRIMILDTPPKTNSWNLKITMFEKENSLPEPPF